MNTPSPLHRHQSSLEGIIDFTAKPPIDREQYQQARRRFYEIVSPFEISPSSNNTDQQYDRAKLVRLTYEYARSEESKGNFLRAFFQSMDLSLDGEENIDFSDAGTSSWFRTSLFAFADYLLENFFLPLKASTQKTPRPSPAYHSAIQRIQEGSQDFAGTPERVSALRDACLVRDRYRCVISRRFGINEGVKRMTNQGDEALDDDGVPLHGESFEALEVAHILPHSLTRANASSQFDHSKEAALAILNMFDNGIVHLIEGTDIDRPSNALTLNPTLHLLFGNFKVFFEPVENQQPHTYQVKTFLPPGILQGLVPVTRTFYLMENRTIDPPSPRLLAIHSAIAHILHLSGAGNYIDTILRDMGEHGVRGYGSTELERLVKLHFQGWSFGEVGG